LTAWFKLTVTATTTSVNGELYIHIIQLITVTVIGKSDLAVKQWK
jgi:hypothetical protein